MPFTFSHPAAVFPFLHKRLRGKFSATGLIVGSITPDFESFIHFGYYKVHSHKWLGMFWYDMPLAIAIAFVFHLTVRDPFIEHLTTDLRRRFEAWHGFNWWAYVRQHYIVFLYSLLLGILTHFLWDATTHLNMTYPDSIRSKLMFGHWRVYILLQYGFSLLGLYIVAAFIDRLPKKPVRHVRKNKALYWIYVILASVIIGAYAITSVSDPDHIDWLYVVNVCIASLLSALIAVSAVYKFINRSSANA